MLNNNHYYLELDLFIQDTLFQKKVEKMDLNPLCSQGTSKKSIFCKN